MVQLARSAIEAYIKEGKIITPPAELTPEMKVKAGVFVSLKKQGELRGCIGTFYPAEENVAKEIIKNAISSAAHDPRFLPVEAYELKDLSISVDVLTKPEKVASIEELNAKKYGVIVQAGELKGLLLPDLEGINTPEDQIALCRRKAGIGEHEPVELYRFEVKRYK